MPALFGFTIGRSRGRGRERRHRNVKLQIEELERRELLSTYFVSPSGNDNNPGTSATAPWQSINRVNQATFQAGDQLAGRRDGGFTRDRGLLRHRFGDDQRGHRHGNFDLEHPGNRD